MSDYTIGIKLGDGSFYPVLEEGFTGKKRFVLSTVRDNQESVQIDFYRNQDEDIESAEYIGSLMIEDIEPSPKGTPEIEVILGLDHENKLNAVAKNLASDDKQTLSVVLESLEGESILGMPEFELDEDIETTEVMDDEKEPDDESITGDTYPFEEEDRRKKRVKKKRNPLFLVLFVLVGLIGIAGLLILTYWLFTSFGVIDQPPLTADDTQEVTDQEEDEAAEPVKTDDKDASAAKTDEADDKKADTTLTDNKQKDDTSQTIQDDKTETKKQGKDESVTEKKTEPLKTGFYYLIKKGDTLWDISATFYRDPFQWYRIYREPKNHIKNPDLIFAGNRLYIPEK
ncbi:MAG: LysM peptidoglycan-binding domain-containing protein [Spirochaetales bacterium]|nr:LysM peptidoglycan-binding domain-containing protein [Spirochaetales bacterium]